MKTPSWLRDLVEPARRKVRRMPTEQMGLWVDAAGTEMSRSFAEYVRTRDEVHLVEFERGLGTLIAFAEELRVRNSV